jgi:hypothetical protein
MKAAASEREVQGEVVVLFSLADEIDLRAYFACTPPLAPGDRSSFGAMCARIANSRNRRSLERPSPDAPWTELLECHPTRGGDAFAAEDAFVAYIDARRRFGRIRATLAHLSFGEYAALEAYFGPEPLPDHPLGKLAGLGQFTATAQRKNRARAVRGFHEPAGATIRWLAATPTREARAALDDIRREAAELLRHAKASFALARVVERAP